MLLDVAVVPVYSHFQRPNDPTEFMSNFQRPKDVHTIASTALIFFEPRIFCLP